MSLLVREVSTAASYGLTKDQKRQNAEIHGKIFARDYEELKKLLINADFHAINSAELLDSALTQGNHDVLELLLAHGVIPDYNRPVHVWSQSLLSRAIIKGNHKIIQLLVKYGCDPDTPLQMSSKQKFILDVIPYNYWYRILELDNLPIFKCLLESKGRKIGNDDWCQKILLAACGLESMSIVRYLLDEGVSTESADEKNWTCLFYAVAYRQIHIFFMLVHKRGNIKHKDSEGRSLLHIPLYYYNMVSSSIMPPKVLVDLLMDRNADVNATDNKGMTPINAAFTIKNVDNGLIWLFLRRRDVNFSKPDNDGITVLHRFISINYRTPIRSYDGDMQVMMPLKNLLIRLDVEEINAKDRWGRTALHYINCNNMNHYLSVLLDFGADSKILQLLKPEIYMNENFLRILGHRQLKREIAGFSKDRYIDELLNEYGGFWEKERDEHVSIYSKEIQEMKETKICDDLTFYDYLHAKRRNCIELFKKSEISEKCIYSQHNFKHYENMIFKKFVCGARPMTPNEYEAMSNAHENLSFIFNYRIPDLVVYHMNQYIGIRDAMALKKVVDSSDENEKIINE